MSEATAISLDQYRAQLANSLQACGIPRQMWSSVIEYIVQGHPVGDFLAALLSNDLMRTAAKADAMNLPRLPDYVQFLYNCAPAGCFGSPAAFNEWLRTGGVIGRQQQREASNAQT